MSKTAQLAEPIVSDAMARFTSSRDSDLFVVQFVNCRLNELPAPFAPHDQSRANLPKLDHVGHLHDPAQQPQTRVRHVVDQTLSRQAKTMMHTASRRRLQVIAAYRPVHECADFAPLDPRRSRLPCRRLRCSCSLGKVPRGQNRRSRTPVISSKRPSGSRSRSYSGANRRSISPEVTISSGSA